MNGETKGWVNTKALRKRMIDFDLTNAEMADKVGISQSKMSFILNHKQAATLEIAERIQETLGIDDSQFAYYFLSHEK